MKKKLILNILICFSIISILFISGCNITPENADIVAKSIQEKYDNITSYETKIESASGQYSKEVMRQLKKPDKFKDALIKNGEIVRVEICNKDTQIYYDITSGKATAAKVINFGCAAKISEFFNAFDKIKNLFNYKYSTEDIELEGKSLVHLTLSSKDSEHDNWSEQFWFDKSNYQLVKHSYAVNGKETFENFDNLQLNADIQDKEFEFEFPKGTDVSVIDAQGGLNIPMTEAPPQIPK